MDVGVLRQASPFTAQHQDFKNIPSPLSPIIPARTKGLAGQECAYDVCEIFSPSRVCAAAAAGHTGVRRGRSIDLQFVDPVSGKNFDLTNSRDQKEIKKTKRHQKGRVVSVSVKFRQPFIKQRLMIFC